MSGDTKKKFDFGEELEDLEPANWTPHPEANDPELKPDLDQVRKIAEEQGFTSREPIAAPAKQPESQVLIRGPESVIDDFKAFGKAQTPKWPHAYVLERAMAALKRELEGQGG